MTLPSEREASFIIRGIRTVNDFEYEETIADINRKLAGIETILLFTEPELTSVSSTIVRELLAVWKRCIRLSSGRHGSRIKMIEMHMNNQKIRICFIGRVVGMDGTFRPEQVLDSPSRKLQLAEFAISNLM